MKQFYLKSFISENFRNLISEKIEFSPKINCIFGGNGNGKTNLLEGIYLVIKGKSFRKNTYFPQYLSTDHLKTQIRFFLEVINENKLINYNISIKPNDVEIYIDGLKEKKRLALESVFINPFDSYHFHHTSSFRRNLMDDFLRQLYPSYKTSLNRYKKSLKFRNQLLIKKGSYLDSQLDAIEKELSICSVEILKYRDHFLEEISSFLKSIFHEIFHENHELSLSIKKNMNFKNIDDFIREYKKSRERELYLNKTTRGVHLDDYIFFFNGMNSFEYCSLGQQKMSYFSLIFAYIELFRYNYNGLYPIVLLDDISGELDEKRWKNLIEYLQRKTFQVFITTANENFKKELEKLKDTNKIFVENGRLTYQS